MMHTSNRTQLTIAAAILALLLLGCTEYTDVMGDDGSSGTPAGDDDASDDDAGDDDTADDDTADDDAGDDDAGDDDTAAAHALEIQYDFGGFYDPASTCADAWISTLWITLTHDGQEQPLLSFPCDDTPILITPIGEGSWTVMAVSVEQVILWDGPYAASEIAAVEVTAPPATVPVHLTLVCDENGWDDGCGGA
jgi:hypothetical protein